MIEVKHECESLSQVDLFNFFKELTRLIFPDPCTSIESDKRLEELKKRQLDGTNKKAVLTILVDGKSVFGIPIGLYTDNDEEELMSAIEAYRSTIAVAHKQISGKY